MRSNNTNNNYLIKNNNIKIVIVTSGDSLSRLALSDVLHQLPDTFRLSGIVLTGLGLLKKLGILRRAFQSHSLYYAIYLLLESFLSNLYIKKSKIKLFDFDSLPKIYSKDTMDEKVQKWIKSLSPDLIISVRPGVIFKNEFINNSPPILNLHHTNLPSYRGIGGVFQMMISGEEALASSVHLISSEKVDFGNVYSQCFMAMPKHESVLFCTIALYKNSSLVLADGIMNFLNNNVVIKESEGSYYSWPGKEALTLMRNMKIKFIGFIDVLGCFLERKNRLR